MSQCLLVLGILLFSCTIAARVPDQILMISPNDDQKILVREEHPIISFEWKEPDPLAKYFLALYLKGKKDVPVILPVSGGRRQIKLKKIPEELHWVVYQRTPEVNSLPVPSGKRYRMDFDRRGIDFKPQGPIIRFAGLHVRNEFELEASTTNRNATLSGPLYEASIELFPPDLGLRYSLNLTYRFSSQESGENEIEQQRWLIEFGRVLGESHRFHHQIYAGVAFINKVDFKLGNAFDTGYDKRLLSGRYLFRGQLTQHIAFEMNTALLMPTSFNVNPSLNLKLGPNIRLLPGWWLDLFVLYENYTYKLTGPPGAGDVTVKQSFNGYGVGLTKSW